MGWLWVFWYHSKNLRFNQCTKHCTTILNLLSTRRPWFHVVTHLTHFSTQPTEYSQGHYCTNQSSPADTTKTFLWRVPKILGWTCYFEVCETDFFFCLIPAKRNYEMGSMKSHQMKFKVRFLPLFAFCQICLSNAYSVDNLLVLAT